MSPKNIAENILEKIKKGSIKQKPKWHFLAKDILFWATFIISVFIGARVVGVIIYAFTQFDFAMLARSHGGLLLPMVRAFPFLWIIGFSVFLLLAILGLHQTEKGYKLSLPKLIGLNVLLSIVCGVAFFGFGDAPKFDNRMAQRLPFYHGIEQQNRQIWNNQQEGRLAGEIVEIQDDFIVIKDFKNRDWEIDIRDCDILPNVNINLGNKIRMIGRAVSGGKFKADLIVEWDCPRNPMFFKNSRMINRQIQAHPRM